MPPGVMDELQQTLVDMRKKGMTTDKIAETLNLSTDTVIWLITHLDVKAAEKKPSVDVLVDWSTIGEKPDRIALLGRMIASLVREKLQVEAVDGVYGLTYEGVPLAQAVAADLDKPCVIVKTQGDMEFISPFFDVKGKDIIIVDHVINTGRTLTRVIQEIKKTDTKPLGIFVFVDKRPWKRDEEEVAGVAAYSLVRAIRA